MISSLALPSRARRKYSRSPRLTGPPPGMPATVAHHAVPVDDAQADDLGHQGLLPFQIELQFQGPHLAPG